MKDNMVFWKSNSTFELEDPPRYIDWVEKDIDGNTLFVDRFHGNGITERIENE